jgi:DNA-binding SARP family transcriptional activator
MSQLCFMDDVGRTRGRVVVRLLNGFSVIWDGSRVALSAAPARLVACLAVGSAPRTRSAAAGLLWPDLDEQHALANLRSALWRVRQACPPLVDHSASALCLGGGVSVDLYGLAAWARNVLDPRAEPASLALPETDLRPELLPGWDEEWLVDERESLQNLYVHALESVAYRLTRAGRFGEAMLAADAAVDIDPWRESAWRAAISVQLAQNNVVIAAHLYGRFHRLMDEIGVEPSSEIRDLIAGIVPVAPERASLTSGQRTKNAR